MHLVTPPSALLPVPPSLPPADHDEHHRLFDVNFAFPFPFMDLAHGTYRGNWGGREWRETRAGKGPASSGAAADAPAGCDGEVHTAGSSLTRGTKNTGTGPAGTPAAGPGNQAVTSDTQAAAAGTASAAPGPPGPGGSTVTLLRHPIAVARRRRRAQLDA